MTQDEYFGLTDDGQLKAGIGAMLAAVAVSDDVVSGSHADIAAAPDSTMDRAVAVKAMIANLIDIAQDARERHAEALDAVTVQLMRAGEDLSHILNEDAAAQRHRAPAAQSSAGAAKG